MSELARAAIGLALAAYTMTALGLLAWSSLPGGPRRAAHAALGLLAAFPLIILTVGVTLS